MAEVGGGERRHVMKAIRVEEQGEPVKLVDIAPIEAPGPGQAVVRVVAAGVNFLDVGQRRGTYPRQVPFTLGVEGAGVVESVGEGVRSVKPSDRVAFTGMPGAYSEAILADAERLIPLPDEFAFEEGAAFSAAGHDGTLPDPRIPAACSRPFRPHSRGCGRDGRTAGAMGQASWRERDWNSLD